MRALPSGGATRALQADAPGFIRETREILAALSSRIRREHTELYAIADPLAT